MTNDTSSSVRLALDVARRHAATAAVAVGLVPLAALPASATVALPARATVTGSTSTANGLHFETYTISATAGGGSAITFIELPEINFGDINFNYVNGSASLPQGWTATEFHVRQGTGAALYSGTAGGFVDLTGGYIGPGGTTTFTALVPVAGTVNAAFGVGFSNSSTAVIDPPIPNTAGTVSAVPEPASLAMLALGLVGLGAVRRRS